MRVLAALALFVLRLIAIACVVASCFYAFEFGLTRSPDPMLALGLGLTAAALDLLKTALPLLSSHTSEWSQKAACWIGFVILTTLSLWCAYGMSATQLAEKITRKEVAEATKSDVDGKIARARAARDALPQFTPTTSSAVEVVQDAVTTAKKQREAECAKRGPNCRNREADERTALANLAKAQSELALTQRAAELDKAVKDAEALAAGVDMKSAATKADPQSEDMAKLIGADVSTVQLFSGMLFAVSIEFGSGLAFWLVFHRRPVPTQCTEPPECDLSTQEAQDALPAPYGAQLEPLVDTPSQVRARFFDECLLPDSDGRIPGASLYVAYAKWCADNDFEPMNSHAFGRDPPWEKRRIGGNVVYVGCRLIEAYANTSARSQLRVVSGGDARQ